MTDMRTNPSRIDNGGGRLNSLGEGLFLDYPSGNTLSVPARVSQQTSQDNDGYYGKSYNNGPDVIKNPTLLQKSLKYVGRMPYARPALLAGSVFLLWLTGCGSPAPTVQPAQETTPPVTATTRAPPTKEPSSVLAPIAQAAESTATPVPPTAAPPSVLGNDYQERIVRTGYSRDIAERIASLRYSETNRRFADEIVLIGERAGYAQERLVKLALSAMEDGDISEDELAVITDPDKDGKDNKTEINGKSNVLDRFNRLPPSIESLAVLDDELYAVVARDDNLSYAFNLQNFKSMIRELGDTPYREALLGRLDKLSEAWNYKVRREDEVLCVIIPKYQSGFDCNSAEARQFREDNGTYHLKLWLDGNSILPLDNAGLSEWFEKREDAEFVYMNGLWVPYTMLGLDLSDMKNVASRTGRQRDERQWVTLKNNMDVIVGVKKINGLPYKDLRERIVRVSADKKLRSYPNSRTPVFREQSDYEISNWLFRQRQAQAGLKGFDSTLGGFGVIFDKIESAWDKTNLGIILPYGLGIIDGTEGGDLPEQFDTATFSIYAKAVGYASFDSDARYPEYTGVRGFHQAPLFPVPHLLLQQLPSGFLVYHGTIGPYSNINGLRKDKVPYVRVPNTGKIVWRLEN